MIGSTAPFGLLLLLLIAAVATLVLLSGIIAYDALHPPRHTAGWAVARGLPADPGDAGLDFESWTLDLPRDVKLPVWEIAARRGDGATVLFVHGWGESRIDMLRHLEPWLDGAARIVLYDRRGHGDATGTARLGTGEHRDLHALLDRLGDSPFVLVGHGTGGAVAVAAAAGRAVSAVVTCRLAADPHAVIRNRLRSRGLPARPLTDLAMLWLACAGVRRRDLIVDKAALRCPLLADPDRDAIASQAHQAAL